VHPGLNTGQQTLFGLAIIVVFIVATLGVVLFALTSSSTGCDPTSALPWLRC